MSANRQFIDMNIIDMNIAVYAYDASVSAEQAVAHRLLTPGVAR